MWERGWRRLCFLGSYEKEWARARGPLERVARGKGGLRAARVGGWAPRERRGPRSYPSSDPALTVSNGPTEPRSDA